jgi:hypothetical protein
MDVQRGHESERPDSGAATISHDSPPGSESCADIQPQSEAEDPSDLPDFDPAPAYEKEIRNGGLPALLSSVHPSAATAPGENAVSFKEADQRLVERLAKNNFAGPEYDLVAERLVTTGYRYCLSWLKNGKMHKKCVEAGRPVGEFPEGVELQHLKDLATDTAVEGAVLFRRVALVGGRWRPDGGASLVTYYVGACIQVYPTIYRRWYRAYRRDSLTAPHDVMPEPDRAENTDFVALKILLEQELDEPTWVALKMKAEGASYAEIAKVLGRSSEKSVEGLLRRGRQRAASIIKQAGEDDV